MIQGYRACAIKTSDDANHFILYTGSYKVVIQIIEDRGIERMPWKLAMMQIILYSIQGHRRCWINWARIVHKIPLRAEI